jgi:hypothetical protein
MRRSFSLNSTMVDAWILSVIAIYRQLGEPCVHALQLV